MNNTIQRRIYDLRGIVQGVGFRPAVSRLAVQARLGGCVQNLSDRVRLQLEGPAQTLEHFVASLPAHIPVNSSIDELKLVSVCSIEKKEAAGEFAIVPSATGREQEVVIPADLAMCSDCERELLDPSNRRYGYPFTTCTACGPRYTVVNAMPYDRERTTLSEFPLCEKCRAEYSDSADRRFHAESIACPACGPQVWAEDPCGQEIGGDPIQTARAALKSGKILALRGIGGFLLAADPFNPAAIRHLRRRKHRPHKPFALMARDLPTLASYAEICPRGEELLSSPISPILIADFRPNSSLNIELINPDNRTIGAMIPTSPLHKLLFEPLSKDSMPPFDLLVMTSGNRGGEPICTDNSEARERLSEIADVFIMHNRAINLRCDDSIFAIRKGAPQTWRRARGCAPDAIRLQPRLARSVLALGAELRNTITVAYGHKLVPSPHIGDLNTPEAVSALEKTARQLPAFLNISPECIAVDIHPDMHSGRVGRKMAEELTVPLVEVQHHHAHAMACLAEHGETSGLALVMDGTGLGDDGTIWGAELLDVSPNGYRRLASFRPVPLPGGDAATIRPARQLAARLIHYGIEPDRNTLQNLCVGEDELEVWRQQIEKGVNTPYTTACGRLFDAWSALLGLCTHEISYDAQAAIRLESAAATVARHTPLPHLPFASREEHGMLWIDWAPAFKAALGQNFKGADQNLWAAAFHQAVTTASLKMIEFGLAATDHESVALSGGVMMNRILTEMLTDQLLARKVHPLLHKRVPPNDGGISVGQAVVAGYGSKT